MQGKIKMFNSTKAFGFIIGEDNNDYFFHATSIQSDDHPAIGMTVEFVPSESTKGLVAKEVKISGSIKINRPIFFCCGKARIRLNNIKDYRIDTIEFAYVDVFDSISLKKISELPIATYDDPGEGYFLTIEFFDEVQNKIIETGRGRIIKTLDGRITYRKDDDIIIRDFYNRRPTECLVITTYQGDTFKFFKDIEARDGNDIYEKLKELDSYFI